MGGTWGHGREASRKVVARLAIKPHKTWEKARKAIVSFFGFKKNNLTSQETINSSSSNALDATREDLSNQKSNSHVTHHMYYYLCNPNSLPHMSFPRPVTSKSRGICQYYDSPRGCFSGNRCKFLHGVPVQELGQNVQPLLTPYDQAKECRYYQRGVFPGSPRSNQINSNLLGFCKRGELCWFKHVDSHHNQTNILEEDDQLCSVCFEKPVTFGLLGALFIKLLIHSSHIHSYIPEGCNHIFCIGVPSLVLSFGWRSI